MFVGIPIIFDYISLIVYSLHVQHLLFPPYIHHYQQKQIESVAAYKKKDIMRLTELSPLMTEENKIYVVVFIASRAVLFGGY